jgi:hypothetical protein
VAVDLKLPFRRGDRLSETPDALKFGEIEMSTTGGLFAGFEVKETDPWEKVIVPVREGRWKVELACAWSLIVGDLMLSV